MSVTTQRNFFVYDGSRFLSVHDRLDVVVSASFRSTVWFMNSRDRSIYLAELIRCEPSKIRSQFNAECARDAQNLETVGAAEGIVSEIISTELDDASTERHHRNDRKYDGGNCGTVNESPRIREFREAVAEMTIRPKWQKAAKQDSRITRNLQDNLPRVRKIQVFLKCCDQLSRKDPYASNLVSWTHVKASNNS